MATNFSRIKLTLFLITILNFAVLKACSPKSIISNAITDLLMPTCQKTKLEFSTVKSSLPSSLDWKEIGFAKELINQFQKIVVI